MKDVLKFWAAMAVVISGIAGLVLGSFVVFSPLMSSKAVGFAWCGVMVVAVVAVFSWIVYRESETERES